MIETKYKYEIRVTVYGLLALTLLTLAACKIRIDSVTFNAEVIISKANAADEKRREKQK